MNLNAYDDAINKIDKTKTWIDVKRKTLISREIKHRAYYSLIKRYDKNTNIVSFFIAMLDKPDECKVCKRTVCDSYGRIKIRLNTIFNETNLIDCESECNVCINLVESDDSGDIYYLDV